MSADGAETEREGALEGPPTCECGSNEFLVMFQAWTDAILMATPEGIVPGPTVTVDPREMHAEWVVRISCRSCDASFDVRENLVEDAPMGSGQAMAPMFQKLADAALKVDYAKLDLEWEPEPSMTVTGVIFALDEAGHVCREDATGDYSRVQVVHPETGEVAAVAGPFRGAEAKALWVGPYNSDDDDDYTECTSVDAVVRAVLEQTSG